MRHYSELLDRRIYRARDGMALGVCKGLARYLDVPVGWVRFFVIVAALLTAFWPMLGAYVAAGLILRPEPVLPVDSEADRDFYADYASDRSRGIWRIKRKFERLDRRIRRMEDTVTSKEYDWDNRFRRGGGRQG